MLLKFLKNWTLPISMLMGTVGYFLFARVAWLAPTKPMMFSLIGFLTPSLIFAQLLLTFCKVKPRELVPTPWHGWLLLVQSLTTLLLVALLLTIPLSKDYESVGEGLRQPSSPINWEAVLPA